jgi:hypothetical protein
MDYIITEHQFNLINEVVIGKGLFDLNVVGNFYDDLSSKSDANLIKITRKYFKDVIGEDISNLSDEIIDVYLRELQFWKKTFNRKITKNMRNSDVISNLAYYLAKESFRMESANGLDYVKVRFFTNGYTYYFFDTDLKELIGGITIEPLNSGDYVNVTMRPYKVSTIVIDKMMKAKGYGTLMYSIVINEMGCLFSDVLLYPEALNMWVNVLPKYYNVGFIDDFGRKKELKGKDRYPKPNDVRHYFACKR